MILYGILLATLTCGTSGAPRLDARTAGARIVNGTDAAPGQYPFMATLRYYNLDYCGATIINPNWVLTAGNCVDRMYPSYLNIRAGTSDINANDGVRVGIKKIVKHPEYNHSNSDINDIAVLELYSPLVFSDLIQPVKLPRKMEDTPEGTPATVIGWGQRYTNGSVITHLQTVDIAIYSDNECRELHNNPIRDTNICAGVPEGGKGACGGDGGAPLLANGQQVGIASWLVTPCGLKGFPGVYTEVSYYIDWINQQTQ